MVKKKVEQHPEMKVYLHKDRDKPTLLIPVNDELFLVWLKRDDIQKPEWTLKSIKHIFAMMQKFGDNVTTFEVCAKSTFLTEATPLEILIIANMAYEEVRDIYNQHLKVLGETKKESK